MYQSSKKYNELRIANMFYSYCHNLMNNICILLKHAPLELK